jgi:queuine tRNA-ribosyltransferase
MAGLASIPARRAFAESLVEKHFGPDAEAIKPLETLDQGVTGYSFDLVPIRLALAAAEKKSQNPFYSPAESMPPTQSAAKSTPSPPSEVNLDPVIPSHTDQLSPLLRASLELLPITKLRLVNTVQTPHEVLRLIASVGIDLFDAHWAQRASDFGVALDFTFPVPSSFSPGLRVRDNGKYDIGHNLYDASYTHDFSPLGSKSCNCRACAPVAPSSKILHGVDGPSYTGDSVSTHQEPRIKPSFMRSYVHHLLHTHEMSAHSLLALHNLSVLYDFFVSIRTVIRDRAEEWEEQVKRFMDMYDENLQVFDEARIMWKDVDLARGKGRLAREKAKQQEATLGTAVEL